MARKRRRADPASFDFPAEQIRAGAFSHRGGLQAREVLLAEARSPRVTVQILAERAGVVCGTDEAVALLKLGVDEWGAITVHALYDGDRVDAWETVMTIEGPYERFAHLEPLCLGVLSRRTRVATNARQLADAARTKPVLIFPTRHDHWLVQRGDAGAAQIGGAHDIWAAPRIGGRNAPALRVVPHALISAFGGDTAIAAQHFARHASPDTALIVPVDYENDSVATALAVARALEPGRLWAVQLATSEHIVDKSIIAEMGAFTPTGVNPQLVWNVRNALDGEGFGDARIVASSGFSVERIRQFEEEGIPVDAYGIGAALYAGRYGFMADVVMLDGKPQGRAGHALRPNSRMERVR